MDLTHNSLPLNRTAGLRDSRGMWIQHPSTYDHDDDDDEGWSLKDTWDGCMCQATALASQFVRATSYLEKWPYSWNCNHINKSNNERYVYSVAFVSNKTLRCFTLKLMKWIKLDNKNDHKTDFKNITIKGRFIFRLLLFNVFGFFFKEFLHHYLLLLLFLMMMPPVTWCHFPCKRQHLRSGSWQGL